MHDRIWEFVGGTSGPWKVVGVEPITGPTLAPVPRISTRPVVFADARAHAPWTLRGARSNERYVTRTEKDQLTRIQAPLGRKEAVAAALIPIRKTQAWWDLAQDERRAILAREPAHIAIGLEYLPAVARRLFHCRDLSEEFDFLTWFEYAPEHATAFDDLLARLRATAEWRYVDREVDVRLILDAASGAD